MDELDELESAADDVAAAFEDEVGENGWPSARMEKSRVLVNW